MALDKITSVSGTAVYVPGSDIDTDRIIPARFMKCVTFDGLGDYLFYDVRYDADGNEKPHPLNDERFKGASILLSGVNFGCGSSREHAPQALYRYGIRAVVAESFAEIFFGNCTTLGVPCVTTTRENINALSAAIAADPTLEVRVDIDNRKVIFGADSLDVDIVESARDALITAKWDPIGELLESIPSVETTVAGLDYVNFRP